MKKNPTHGGAYRDSVGWGGVAVWARAVTGASTAATAKVAGNALESTR